MLKMFEDKEGIGCVVGDQIVELGEHRLCYQTDLV